MCVLFSYTRRKLKRQFHEKKKIIIIRRRRKEKEMGLSFWHCAIVCLESASGELKGNYLQRPNMTKKTNHVFYSPYKLYNVILVAFFRIQNT